MISNKVMMAQRSSINELLTSEAASHWISKLFPASDRWPADDKFDDFSGHCWFVLWRQRE